MKYRSRPVEVEAMQWNHLGTASGDNGAEAIVAWVSANGGEARYCPDARGRFTTSGDPDDDGPVIELHTSTGWAPQRPSDWAINSGTRFDGRDGKTYVDFYPCAPETFERRWEPIAEGHEQQ